MQSNLKIFSLVLCEKSLFFIDLRSVEIFEIGRELKLRTGQEKSVKKAIFFGNSWRLSILSENNFDCVRMNFYVEFFDTCYEKIRKLKIPKWVIFR